MSFQILTRSTQVHVSNKQNHNFIPMEQQDRKLKETRLNTQPNICRWFDGAFWLD